MTLLNLIYDNRHLVHTCIRVYMCPCVHILGVTIEQLIASRLLIASITLNLPQASYLGQQYMYTHI